MVSGRCAGLMGMVGPRLETWKTRGLEGPLPPLAGLGQKLCLPTISCASGRTTRDSFAARGDRFAQFQDDLPEVSANRWRRPGDTREPSALGALQAKNRSLADHAHISQQMKVSGNLEKGQRDFALARAIQLHQHHPLPRTEQKVAFVHQQGHRGTDQRRQNVIGHMRRIMGMPVVQLRNHVLKGVEHVEIGTGIEVGSGQGGRGMQQVQDAHAAFARMLVLQYSLDPARDVEDLPLLVGPNRYAVHSELF